VNLTARELEVIKLTAEGRCVKEIAKELGLSFKSVDSYRQSAYRKIHVSNAVQATRWFLAKAEEKEEKVG
jgi:DNA-binding NarL/FixJ family response regulator